MSRSSIARADFDRQNWICAKIIAGNPQRYPEPGMQMWADLVLKRLAGVYEPLLKDLPNPPQPRP